MADATGRGNRDTAWSARAGVGPKVLRGTTENSPPIHRWEREAKNEARVVPVILRGCKWQESPFGKLQALPKDAEPVANSVNRDKAWTNVADGIEKVVEELRQRRR